MLLCKWTCYAFLCDLLLIEQKQRPKNISRQEMYAAIWNMVRTWCVVHLKFLVTAVSRYALFKKVWFLASKSRKNFVKIALKSRQKSRKNRVKNRVKIASNSRRNRVKIASNSRRNRVKTRWWQPISVDARRFGTLLAPFHLIRK
jgi:hypothetical protein